MRCVLILLRRPRPRGNDLAMNYFLGSLLSFLLLYKYAALFLIIFSAAIIVPWPENTILLAVGAFGSQGYFSAPSAFVVALAANVSGDICGYFLTRRWGYKVVSERHIRKFSAVDRLSRYVKEHSRLTVFITRFFGTVGPMVNFLAGLIGMPLRRFVLFDIIGNIIDIGGFISAGYVLGSLWENYAGLFETAGQIALVLFIIYVVARVFGGRNIKH